MEIKQSLEKLGLTQNEITVYLYLLSNGERLGNQIHKDNLLDKSTAYKAISQLEEKGLIISSGDSRNQTYKVSSKDKVFSLFEKQKEEIDSSQELFTKAFNDLEKYSAQHYQNENIQVFTGEGASDNYHREILKGDVTLIRSIEDSTVQRRFSGGKEKLDERCDWFIDERVKKNIAIRVLYDKNTQPDEYDVTDLTKFKECRRYPNELNITSMFTTFGDRVGFSTMKNGKYWALIIQDKLIVELLNSIYDALWAQSKIV